MEIYCFEIAKIQQRRAELIRRPKTAAELEELHRLNDQLSALLNEETASLISALHDKGLRVQSIWDLVNTKQSYPEVIDTLIDHLTINYHDKNIEGIVRALTVKEAKGKAAEALINLYENTTPEKENLRWIIGNAIANVMTVRDIPWIYSAVSNKRNGISRGQLVYSLGTVKTQESEDVLIRLLDDDDVVPQALAALGRLKSKRARHKIETLADSKIPVVRLEARKALKKI